MNYYELLNIKEKASQNEIKKSYKSLVKEFHPDVYKGDKKFAEKKIKELNQAYEILSDPSSRAEYDRVLNSVRQETSQIFSSSSSANSSNIEFEKNNIEKRYNEIYNYDYYKKYTTNYYGVDKSSEKNHTTSEDTSNTFAQSTRNYILQFISNSSSKSLILLLAFIIIIGLLFTIKLLDDVKYFLSDTSNSDSNNNFIDYSNDRNNYYDYYENQNELYGEYGNYISSYFSQEFDGVIRNGITAYQVTNFYGEPEKYVKKDNLIYAYYQTSYIVYNQLGIIVDFTNNGYFLTDEVINSN